MSGSADGPELGDGAAGARDDDLLARFDPFQQTRKGQVEYSNAFTDEAEAEVLGMFDDDLGLDVPR